MYYYYVLVGIHKILVDSHININFGPNNIIKCQKYPTNVRVVLFQKGFEIYTSNEISASIGWFIISGTAVILSIAIHYYLEKYTLNYTK